MKWLAGRGFLVTVGVPPKSGTVNVEWSPVGLLGRFKWKEGGCLFEFLQSWVSAIWGGKTFGLGISWSDGPWCPG